MSSNWAALQSKMKSTRKPGSGGGGGSGRSGGGGWHPASKASHGKKVPPADSGPPPPYTAPAGSPRLLEPGAAGFDEAVAQCYKGFVKLPASEGKLPDGLEQRVTAALERLKEEGFFHHDVRARCSRTRPRGRGPHAPVRSTVRSHPPPCLSRTPLGASGRH